MEYIAKNKVENMVMCMERLARRIHSGMWPYGHCQGIAVDMKKGYIYYSFTTALIKMDLQGRLIGTVTGLLGHLGCIDYCETDGRVYGSLEYKSDAIGKGILMRAGCEQTLEDAFYIAIFDVDRIDRVGLDACADGVMTTVYLKEVYEDYTAFVQNGGEIKQHRHGCSGIDGLTFGKMPEEKDGPYRLFVAYGVYGDLTRTDNDYQVLLCYDTRDWKRHEHVLSQGDMHRCGPQKPEMKLFVYTGNTRYGVQNLEYDEYTGHLMMAVYRGEKREFPNYDLYVIDGSKAPGLRALRGVEPEVDAPVLSLLSNGEQEETPGWRFAYGATGLCSLGSGYYYISQDGCRDGGFYTEAVLYRWDGRTPFVLVE